MPGGRKPKPIHYTVVQFNNKSYIVGLVQYKDTSIQFVCNSEDEELVRSSHWHVVTGNYIGHNYIDPETNKKKVLYLHNVIMERSGHGGKGQQITVDHINGIGFDNRRENLREVSQSFQNRNTRDRVRKTDRLPADISSSEIPRNIWYMPSHDHHGDRFVIEFKGIPGVKDIEVKTTSSKGVPTRDKLVEAIKIKNEILESHPCLIKYSRMCEATEKLKQEYDQITGMPTD